jgi:hypothetical protein
LVKDIFFFEVGLGQFSLYTPTFHILIAVNGGIIIRQAFLPERKYMKRQFSVERFFFYYFSLGNASMTVTGFCSVFDGG